MGLEVPGCAAEAVEGGLGPRLSRIGRPKPPHPHSSPYRCFPITRLQQLCFLGATPLEKTTEDTTTRQVRCSAAACSKLLMVMTGKESDADAQECPRDEQIGEDDAVAAATLADIACEA